MNDLRSWSWQDIIGIYRILGSQLKEYARLKDSILVVPPAGMNFISMYAFWYQAKFDDDVARINAQVNRLDQEIARRNRLIGVIG